MAGLEPIIDCTCRNFPTQQGGPGSPLGRQGAGVSVRLSAISPPNSHPEAPGGNVFTTHVFFVCLFVFGGFLAAPCSMWDLVP